MPPTSQATKTVLLVDDDETTLHTYETFLKMSGYAVRTATNAVDALQSVAEQPPDVILLDLGLPDAEAGLALLQQLRAEHGALPVGIVTGNQTLHWRIQIEIQELGASISYKPLWLDDLTALVEALVQQTS